LTSVIIRIIYDLNNELSNYGLILFDIQPPQESLDTPEDPRTKVTPAMPISNPREWLKKAEFTDMEIDTLMTLGDSIEPLTTYQIRSLGTHENIHKTKDDIAKEFEYLDPRRLALVEKLKKDEGFLQDSYKMKGFAEEAMRKSKDNLKDYGTGYIYLDNKLRHHPLLKNAFSTSQSQPEKIWNTPEITPLVRKSEKIWALSRYLCVIAYLKDNLDMLVLTKKSQNLHEDWEKIVSDMERCGFEGFYRNFSVIFKDGTAEVNLAVREYLVDQLESLPSW